MIFSLSLRVISREMTTTMIPHLLPLLMQHTRVSNFSTKSPTIQIMDHPPNDPTFPTPQRCFVNIVTNLFIQPRCARSFMDISKEIKNPPTTYLQLQIYQLIIKPHNYLFQGKKERKICFKLGGKGN